VGLCCPSPFHSLRTLEGQIPLRLESVMAMGPKLRKGSEGEKRGREQKMDDLLRLHCYPPTRKRCRLYFSPNDEGCLSLSLRNMLIFFCSEDWRQRIPSNTADMALSPRGFDFACQARVALHRKIFRSRDHGEAWNTVSDRLFLESPTDCWISSLPGPFRFTGRYPALTGVIGDAIP
jgi:hypothetical protein